MNYEVHALTTLPNGDVVAEWLVHDGRRREC
jgi:hypothetical protein